MPGLRPIVEGIDTVLLLNSTISAADLFTVSDPENDPITSYTFSDSPGAASGFFLLNGVAIENGSTFTIDADELGGLFYVGAPVISNETISVRASDGTQLSVEEALKIYSVRTESVRPFVQIESISVLANETILANEFISAFDPDGFPILGYTIRDRNVDRSFFTLDGEELAQGVFHNLSANEFDRLTYNAVGRRVENIDVFAFDGTVNSLFTSESIQTEANLNRPVVEFERIDSVQGEVYALKDLVSSFDADGNSIKYYEFKDRNRRSFSGNLFFNGAPLDPGQFHRFTPEQLEDVYYSPGSRNIVEEVRYRVADGRFRSAINSVEFNNSSIEQNGVLNVVANNSEDSVQSHLQTLPITEFFEVADTLALSSIDIIDTNLDPRSANLLLNGVQLPAGQIHTISVEDWFGGENNDEVGLDVRTGTYDFRHLDEIYVRANTSTVNGDWTRVNLRTEPEFILSLFSGNTWNFIPRNDEGKIELTFSFMQELPPTNGGEAVDDPENGMPFIPFSEEQREVTRRLLASIEAYADIDFIEVSDSSIDPIGGFFGGTYRFGGYFIPPPDSDTLGYAGFPGGNPGAGDVYMNFGFTFDLSEGSGGYATLVHEVGHTLGFKHSTRQVDNFTPVLPEATSSAQYTIMQPAATPRPDFVGITSFPIYEVFQMQLLYGANEEHRTGDDHYSIDTFVNGEFSTDVIWDAGGYDTLSASGSQRAAVVDLRAGGFSSIGSNFVNENIAIAFGTEIERGIGSNNSDQLFGNELGNVLIGGNGDDMLQGFGGRDELRGGAGNDTYFIGLGDGNNVINEQQLAGRDRLVIGTFPEFEDFTEDISFSLDGRDLVINLAVDDGTVDTSIRIKDQTRGAFRIETLEFGGNDIDLVNLASQATGLPSRFEITPDTSVFGNLVSPV